MRDRLVYTPLLNNYGVYVNFQTSNWRDGRSLIVRVLDIKLINI
jgi:hypothetical protein